ncbi:MAG: DnaA regulatory inactivator Hda [Pseudomonadota bacterium]
MTQLALPLSLADHAVFESFLPAGNELLIAALRDAADLGCHQGAWVWGKAASGKTHLLQAVCARAGDAAMYLPMTMLQTAGPGILAGLEARSVLCIDDIQLAAGSSDWEQGLFRLYNAVAETDHCLVVASDAPPRQVPFARPDLLSRISRLPVYRVASLADENLGEALKLRARHRGLELPDETTRYLLRHSRRDMRSLYALLDTLDSASLAQQRRLTVPFVREVLETSVKTT